VNLDLTPGSITALLGPNGSGKSTLLKTLSKTLAPLKGTVTVSGKSVLKLSYRDLARKIAFVPQEEYVPFRFLVRDVVLMGRMPHTDALLDSSDDLNAADEALSMAGCEDLADRAITELSGGEKQRVLVARALAQQAPILLLDEPTSHMDIGHQVAIVRLLRKLAREGYTILAAVHDLNLAALLAENAALLHGGAVTLQGTCEEVLDSPLLDKVYGVRFRRLRDDDGALHLFAVG
jgi:iron complex transport system ATP-binding protein